MKSIQLCIITRVFILLVCYDTIKVIYCKLNTMKVSNKLLGQGYVKERLRSSLRKFYGRYGDLIKQNEVQLSQMLHDILDDDSDIPY